MDSKWQWNVSASFGFFESATEGNISNVVKNVPFADLSAHGRKVSADRVGIPRFFFESAVEGRVHKSRIACHGLRIGFRIGI